MSEPTVTVVLIEDDKHIRRFVHTALEADGMRVFDAETGEQGLAQAATRRPDLVIVDLGLPDMDGIDVIRELRSWSTVPVLVLTARTREEHKVAALDAGADDYLTKPFGLPELTARIRAHLRRRTCGGRTGSTKVHFGAVTIDLAERRVTRDSQIVHLTPIEYRLLSALVSRAGWVLTHRQLLQEVWGQTHADNDHYLRVYMGHLRQKLERDPAQPEYIITETGVGYRLVGANDYQGQ
ncbi:two-component system KDP operon response regulator KdpE [Paraburkholderia sp. MM5496-R1]|uniref:Two-component system, OmpR family, KDP operon response regulator KdpE n=1 Tax=Paraburkholderia tuberum TaxID=157910 RepID=A0A1H1J130_9BURK|nr:MULTISPECIES: two-component system response regulator KdpE [Paraburkholderia]MBC8720497.1 two-component system response regulator KdpE [Paraburkholderia sp. 31.1]SDR43500.1 two-component system, OmpR family, KDP operon response regulator KdpE [Paraburkholderia tuberum]